MPRRKPRKCGYRLPDGRQVQRRIGPHWSDRKQEPPPGYFTKASARVWLDEALAKARRGELPGMVRTGTTFAAACEDWLDYKRDRKVKLSTQIDWPATSSAIATRPR